MTISTRSSTLPPVRSEIRMKKEIDQRLFGIARIVVLIVASLVFLFPPFWLVLTALRPAWAMYYVHRTSEITFANFAEVLSDPSLIQAIINSVSISTLATVVSLAVTVPSGYVLSRFEGKISTTWFGTIYVFRCIPYITWIMPLYVVSINWGVYDTMLGLLLPHIAIHVCFFTWIMKGFFDAVDPSPEYAAMVDGCDRWKAFYAIAIPAALPGIVALGVLCWLFTWNEFLFALILTSHNFPVVTVTIAQFAHEMGTEWNLMAASAVLSMIPGFLVILVGQKYIIRGLKI